MPLELIDLFDTDPHLACDFLTIVDPIADAVAQHHDLTLAGW